MNALALEKKVLILSLLSEENSIRSIERMTGVHRDTIMHLTVSVGEKCAKFLDQNMNNLRVNQLHVDEVWSYVGKHQKRIGQDENDHWIGDQYCFVAMDSETKLIPAFKLAKRSGSAANGFMYELFLRIVTKFQLSTDAFAPYENAVDRVWGTEIDYGQV